MGPFDEMPSDGRIGGFLLGTVLANSDDDKKGTLKIRLGCEGSSKNILEGVKLLASSAGAAYGVYLLPEVGEQVVVGFLDGCFDRPFVLGSLYTLSDKMLSESYHKENLLKRFKTKGGTLVEFGGKQGEESITIKTPQALSVVMQEKPQTITVTAGGDTKLEIDGKNGKLSVAAKQEISLKTGSAELTMKSSGEIKLKGTGIELKSDSKLKAESGGTLELKGQKSELSGAMTEVKASGILTLKGSMTKIN